MAEQKLQIVIDAQNNAQSQFSKLGNTLVGLGLSYGILKKGIIDSITAFDESEKVMAQTNAVLASTKGVAGMSASAVSELAKSIQMMSTFDDEAVQGAENLLLTFTSIGKDVFPQATQAVVDMSQAMGQDLKSTSIQVGKALQDPILGVTALRRVGVNFNSTQQEMIKKMVETGKTMDAQKYILKELATEFGGSASAQLNTFGGRMKWLQNQVGDVQEVLGGTLVNTLTAMVGGFNMSADGTVQALERVKKFITTWLPAIMIGLQATFQFIGVGLSFIGNGVFAFGKILVAVFQDAWQTIKNLGSGFVQLGQVIKQVMTGDFEGAMAGFAQIQVVASAKTQQAIEEESSVMGNLWEQMKSVGTDAMDNYARTQNVATGETKGMTGATKALGESTEAMGKKIADGQKKIDDLVKAYKKAVQDVKNDIKDLKTSLKDDNESSDKDLGKNIATEIVAKQSEAEKLRAEIAKEGDATKKAELQAQLDDIMKFLGNHKQEEVTYAKEILEAKKVAGLDSIQLLQYQHDQEQIERDAQFKKDMADLKSKLNEVKKEYKDKFKELKKELKDAGLDQLEIKIKAIIETIKTSSSSSHRAVGGSVTGGESYMVGENGPEMFTPNVGGSINNNPTSNNNAKTVNFSFNFSGAIVGDKNSLIAEITRAINRQQELTSLGIR
jgi:hypothetical protein